MADKTQTRNEGGKAADKPFHVALPQLNLPKGGSAVRGIGEKFAANPATGTGSIVAGAA